MRQSRPEVETEGSDEGRKFWHTCVNDSQSIAYLTISFCPVRCDRAGLAGTIRLAAVRCPAGLAFDIDRQTCDWRANVKSCDKLSSKS